VDAVTGDDRTWTMLEDAIAAFERRHPATPSNLNNGQVLKALRKCRDRLASVEGELEEAERELKASVAETIQMKWRAENVEAECFALRERLRALEQTAEFLLSAIDQNKDPVAVRNASQPLRAALSP
jgi:chromosome segregation ATPase